ncbi:biotin--[acetyl-CoA-carboxylase] ligase [Roseospirillum parvum]|uniref:biotin--[biotin carboxyl-carrier protein] ligase n=1 Tax=Roseospirillum parvum TaxID=83401 RepID=A0A1G8B582_9PROT|nr:biotin--[acetyl-CoA-carboxylase] ligase [Roseospirillum parvum]SDH28301.1 BirA family transcriptional regulator, biotin operon repressor / biotin-[acetyl-CoA-carboxylase] ligase [Roseospirillum parvum]
MTALQGGTPASPLPQAEAALPPGWRLLCRDEVDGTNATLVRWAEGRGAPFDGAPAEGVVLVADQQTAGRGRQGRDWHSPPGNLYVSVLLDGAAGPARLAEVGFVAGVALAEAVAALMPAAAPALKWPNDLLLDGRKVAGLLLETALGTDGGPWLVLGLGVNLAWAPPRGPEMAFPPGRLADAGPAPGRDALLAALVPRLAVWLAVWRHQGFAPIRAAWLERAHGLGGPIEARLGTGKRHGVFADIDPDGALVLDTETGRERLLAADIHFPDRDP